MGNCPRRGTVLGGEQSRRGNVLGGEQSRWGTVQVWKGPRGEKSGGEKSEGGKSPVWKSLVGNCPGGELSWNQKGLFQPQSRKAKQKLRLFLFDMNCELGNRQQKMLGKFL